MKTKELEEQKQQIASIIQTARVQKGWSARELGEKVGMSQNTISRIENARFFPSMESLILILDCLDLPLKINDQNILPWKN